MIRRSLTRHLTGLLLAAVVVAGLYAARVYSYLLFHAIVEIFAITVGTAVFMLAWNSRRYADSHFILWIGIGYLFVALIDLAHTLTFPGMGVMELGVNTAAQLWIAARFLQALVLLAAPFFLTHRLRPRVVMPVFAGVVTLALLTIFAWDVFPDAYNDAAGRLTAFKIAAEYIIAALLLLALGYLLHMRQRIDDTVLTLLAGAIVVTLVSEITFTLYTDPYGPANMIGHYLKLFAFYLIYKAVVEVGLRRPYDLLFRDLARRERALQHSRRQLQALNETLEQRVAQRTEQLRDLAREVSQAERRERRRLAAMLHDEVQQTLAAARLQLKLGRAADPPQPEALDRATELLGEAIETSRSLAAEVSPAIVRDRGLPEALRWLSDQMSRRHDLQVKLDLDPSADTGEDDMNVVVFRAVRELLFNVVKHAGVNHASLRTARTDSGGLRVIVEDDGNGFDPEALTRADSGEAFGLSSLCGRLDLLGGECEIDSTLGDGTRVTLHIPPRTE